MSHKYTYGYLKIQKYKLQIFQFPTILLDSYTHKAMKMISQKKKKRKLRNSRRLSIELSVTFYE